MNDFELTAGKPPTGWRRISAITGRGDLLIGSDEHGVGPGAMVMAPPGVLLRGPKGSEALTREGWRQARWGPDRTGKVFVDQTPPKALIEIGLGQVVEDLSNWAPEHLVWVAEIVERNMRVLIGRMRRDCKDAYSWDFEQAYVELTALHREADEAFARVQHRHEVPQWLTEGHFSSMRHAYLFTVQHDDEAYARAKRKSRHNQVSH